MGRQPVGVRAPSARALAVEAPGAVVVVDPVRTPTAEQADLHLQPFPGSDAALAFGLVHVLARDGLVAEDFLARHAIGWEELLELAAPV